MRAAAVRSNKLGVRNFATEEQLKKRMKSIGNIKKITGAMKMVASARLRKSQQRLQAARVYVAPITEIWPEPTDEAAIEEALAASVAEGASPKTVIAAIACDRGLCGAMNSSIVRDLKKKLDERKEQNDPATLVTFGEKGRSGLERVYGNEFEFAISESGKSVDLNFKQCAEITDKLLSTEPDKLQVVSNWYRNAIAFDTNTANHYGPNVTLTAEPATFEDYEIEGPEGEEMQNFHEFRLACIMWGHFAEADTCELSSRVNAMSNSSTSAGDILERITLQYNTMRQAKITTELIEIISGATAAEEQVQK